MRVCCGKEMFSVTMITNPKSALLNFLSEYLITHDKSHCCNHKNTLSKLVNYNFTLVEQQFTFL